MFKYLLGLALSIGLLSFNTAWAVAGDVACKWSSEFSIVPPTSLASVVDDGVSLTTEKYDCNKDQDGNKQCKERYVWKIANRTYSTKVSVQVLCVNFDNKSEKISYNFARVNEEFEPSLIWQNLTMSISGSGQLSLRNIESMEPDKQFSWGGVNLAPCKKNCWDMETAWPRYNANLTFTFSVRPKALKSYYGPFYDLQDPVGVIWIGSGPDKESVWSTSQSPYLPVCGLGGQGSCTVRPGAGSGGSWSRPPIKQCTLTIVTPDVVTFQPISSDDLSRNRVRSEDFTLTAIKGPSQSTTCLGSVYNLPGEIKTQGGYSISSTFWGINHSSGVPQGVGLKLYDLGKNEYLRFNHQYDSFISDISSISESKRIRAEISATTKDLKKIKDGTYSQVLTFEVNMP